MLSNNQIKFIKSLKDKKYREQENSFVVEGPKLVDEAIKSNCKIKMLCSTNHKYENLAEENNISFFKINEKVLKSISSLVKPNQVLAVLDKNKTSNINKNAKIVLALDEINDPGNMGTIIRLAEWFGINDLLCSENCVEIYNPKVVQSSMGSLFRMNIVYKNLVEFLSENSTHQKMGALLDGENINSFVLDKKPLILIVGSESHGISKDVQKQLDCKISIPRYNNSKYPESLNAASATAILLAKISEKIY